MYLDLTDSHYRFAAYETQGSYKDYMDWYQNSDYYKNELAERQQAAGYERQVNQENNDYRNRALAQQGASSRAATQASRANAQLAASTQIKTQKMQIDATYRMFKEKMDALDIPTLQLDAWYKNAQVGLLRGEFALKAAAPRNALQYSAAMGQATGSYLPASLAALARNEPYRPGAPSGTPEKFDPNPYLGDQGAPAQAPGSAGVAGAAGTMGQDAAREQAVRAAMKDTLARGPGGVAPGVYESLPGYDQEIFKSVLADSGYDPEDWLQRRAMVGIGQGNVLAA